MTCRPACSYLAAGKKSLCCCNGIPAFLLNPGRPLPSPLLTPHSFIPVSAAIAQSVEQYFGCMEMFTRTRAHGLIQIRLGRARMSNSED